MRYSVFVLLWIFVIQGLFGQGLDFWGDVMFNAVEPEHRELAASHFLDSIKAQLPYLQDTSRLEGKKWVLQSLSDDGELQIISSGYEKDNGSYYYVCHLRYKGGEWHTLKGQSDQYKISERREVALDQWYGAWYKDIVEFHTSGQTYYLLMGKSKYNHAYDAKICEVIWFDEENQLHIGAPLFLTRREGIRDKVRHRLVIIYSDPGNVILRHEPDSGVLAFNHIVEIPYETYEGLPLRVQDGSYEIYRRLDEHWIYEEYMFDSTARPIPDKSDKPEEKSRDILGRPRN